jgi:hypothetical protein
VRFAPGLAGTVAGSSGALVTLLSVIVLLVLLLLRRQAKIPKATRC